MYLKRDRLANAQLLAIPLALVIGIVVSIPVPWSQVLAYVYMAIFFVVWCLILDMGFLKPRPQNKTLMPNSGSPKESLRLIKSDTRSREYENSLAGV